MSAVDHATAGRLEALAEAHALPAGSAAKLVRLLDLVESAPLSLTAVREPGEGVNRHIADSLTGMGVAEIAGAGVLADLGSGAGFPGLVLAVALPATRVVLVESVVKKAAFLRSAADELGLENVDVVADRAEGWAAGHETCDVVTARALAPLAVLVEYAAPLLRIGGSLVAWKGVRDADEEAGGAAAAELVGLTAPEPRRATQPRAAERHLYLSRKVSPTPERYPRRPGMARKRPLGG